MQIGLFSNGERGNQIAKQRERSMRFLCRTLRHAWPILIPQERPHEQECSNSFKMICEGRLANAT